MTDDLRGPFLLLLTGLAVVWWTTRHALRVLIDYQRILADRLDRLLDAAAKDLRQHKDDIIVLQGRVSDIYSDLYDDHGILLPVRSGQEYLDEAVAADEEDPSDPKLAAVRLVDALLGKLVDEGDRV